MNVPASAWMFRPAALAALLLISTRPLLAQEATEVSATTPDAAPPATVTVTPQLSYGVSEIVKMSQANVNDPTIIQYIQTAGNGYGLNADQIIYLKQQGVSDAVVNTMLAQSGHVTGGGNLAVTVPAGSAPAEPAAPATDTDTASPITTVEGTPAAPVVPVTIVTAAPVSPVSVYVIPAPSIYTAYTDTAKSFTFYRPGCHHPGYTLGGSVSVTVIGSGGGGGQRGGWYH